ncbi:RrF2 family transcriptional regulator [Chloroflexota bacterium]
MKLSTRGRYSTRAMLELAIHFKEGPTQVKDIAERQRLSERYLEQLFIPLRQHGLVKGLRGMHGGFTLAKPPSKIKLSEIIRAAEGTMTAVKCINDPKRCAQSDACLTRRIWAEVERATSKVLDSITLQDLVRQQKDISQALECIPKDAIEY